MPNDCEGKHNLSWQDQKNNKRLSKDVSRSRPVVVEIGETICE